MIRPALSPRRAALALALSLVLAAPAVAGPPWISVEIPANPHDRSTRGALLLVRAYHHASGVAYRVTGTAEGLVDRRRVSRPLTVTPTGVAGVYAVARPQLEAGNWVLVLRLEAGHGGAAAIVPLDARGEVAGARVPTRRSVDGWTIPREVEAADIDAALRGEYVADSGTGPPAGVVVAALGALALVPLVARRRGR